MKFVSSLSLLAALVPALAAAQPVVVQNGTFKPAAFIERLKDQKLPDGCTITRLELHEASGQNAEYASIGLHQIARDVNLEINGNVPVEVYSDGSFKASYSDDLAGLAKTSLTVLFNKDLSVRSLQYSQSSPDQPVAEKIDCLLNR
jgi:hypothetical protein